MQMWLQGGVYIVPDVRQTPVAYRLQMPSPGHGCPWAPCDADRAWRSGQARRERFCISGGRGALRCIAACFVNTRRIQGSTSQGSSANTVDRGGAMPSASWEQWWQRPGGTRCRHRSPLMDPAVCVGLRVPNGGKVAHIAPRSSSIVRAFRALTTHFGQGLWLRC